MSTYKISSELAQEIAEFIYDATGYPATVCDENAVMIGDSLKKRIGLKHKGAQQILLGKVKDYCVTAEEASRDSNLREGYNVAIIVNGEMVGTTGISGKIEVAKPLVMVTSRILVGRITDEIRRSAVNQVVQNVSDNVRLTATEIEKISAASQEVAATAESVARVSAEAGSKVQDTGKIIDLSHSIASQIKLLSLNASIEAARAGEAGRGFSVVATEMQKLSQNSSDATNHISQILTEIHEANKETVAGIDQLTTVLRGQAAGLEHIADMSGSVEKAAKDLVKVFAEND